MATSYVPTYFVDGSRKPTFYVDGSYEPVFLVEPPHPKNTPQADVDRIAEITRAIAQQP